MLMGSLINPFKLTFCREDCTAATGSSVTSAIRHWRNISIDRWNSDWWPLANLCAGFPTSPSAEGWEARGFTNPSGPLKGWPRPRPPYIEGWPRPRSARTNSRFQGYAPVKYREKVELQYLVTKFKLLSTKVWQLYIRRQGTIRPVQWVGNW